VDPGAGVDAVVKRKNHCPGRDSKPGRPSHSLVIILTELFRLLSDVVRSRNIIMIIIMPIIVSIIIIIIIILIIMTRIYATDI
jgi:hypothetical protein